MSEPEITNVSDLGADAKCPICYDTGHIIVDDTTAEYVTAPCPECDVPFNDMATAPRDGTMLLLKVRFTENSTEDAEVAVTIGANNLDHDEIDEWKFAGWCWTHDCFTEGKGTPIGWLPLVRRP